MAILDRIKSLPWWALILIGLFVVPMVLQFVRKAA